LNLFIDKNSLTLYVKLDIQPPSSEQDIDDEIAAFEAELAAELGQ